MNPFFLAPHTPVPFFCDREKETEDLVSYLENGSNVALISPRRYGKTGLIYHVFDALQAKKAQVELYYVDIYSFPALLPIKKVTEPVLLAIAVKIGKTRLIDNMILGE